MGMNSASFPMSAVCPGCIHGTCNNGMGLIYPPYSGMSEDFVMQCMPVGTMPMPVPEYTAYGYGAPVYFSYPASQYQYPLVHQFHEPHNQGHWQNGGRSRSSRTRGRKTSSSYVHPPELEYAIVAIKTNPQVTLFSIHGEFIT